MTAAGAAALARLEREMVRCTRCPRLVDWREQAAREAPRRHAGESYWARPVPSFGDPGARLLVLGLAPGAHGANRTGRPFTGDRSGAFLYAALHRAGLASAPCSTGRDDGLELRGARVVNAVRCVPPENKPTAAEQRACFPFLARELELLGEVGAVLCLGGLAWSAALELLEARGPGLPRPRPRFGHGAELALDGAPLVLASNHPSPQNTNTGRLRAEDLDLVLARALERLAGEGVHARGRPPRR